MSFPPYSAYKASGIGGVEAVPTDWSVVPVKARATCNDDVLPETTPDEWEILYVEISGVDAVAGIVNVAELTFADAPSRARRKVQDGDVLVSTVRTYLKAIAPVIEPPANMIASTGFAVVRPRGIHPGFLSYLLRSEFVVGEIISRSVGVSYPAINASDLMRIKAPMPSDWREQAAIATFLDRETGKIDALVAEQEKLIELLKEKRQAVISHAVTKGLDPNVPMKDSGVEWLGDVPEHWEVVRLRRVAKTVQTGGTPSSEPPSTDIEGGLNWYTPGDFGGNLRLEEAQKKVGQEVVEQGEARVFPAGAILVVGIGATLGKVGYLMAPASANQQINAIVPSDRLYGEYLAYALSAKTAEMRFLSNASTIGIMNQDKTKEIWMTVPPLDEQQRIVAHLDAADSRVDGLIAEARRAIDLLKERRSALISAAVTGKIDVRGLVSPQPPSQELEPV